ncbi:MAG: hypothetical protein IKG46_01640 [Solobacterium sp.]|nr:hypothetical protein [Solobacterium sp.]
MSKKTGPVLDLVQIAAMTAVLEAAKFLLNALPNVELVTVLLMVYTVHFGTRKAMCSALLFALLESIWWGISIWTVTYFYVWPLLVIVTAMIPKSESAFMYIVLAAAYGLLFGMLCSLTTLVLSGWKAAVAWWVAGIPYDLIHCVSNGIVAAVLFRPLVHALEKLN